jgi:hypothetical protein
VSCIACPPQTQKKRSAFVPSASAAILGIEVLPSAGLEGGTKGSVRSENSLCSFCPSSLKRGMFSCISCISWLRTLCVLCVLRVSAFIWFFLPLVNGFLVFAYFPKNTASKQRVWRALRFLRFLLLPETPHPSKMRAVVPSGRWQVVQRVPSGQKTLCALCVLCRLKAAMFSCVLRCEADVRLVKKVFVPCGLKIRVNSCCEADVRLRVNSLWLFNLPVRLVPLNKNLHHAFNLYNM